MRSSHYLRLQPPALNHPQVNSNPQSRSLVQQSPWLRPPMSASAAASSVLVGDFVEEIVIDLVEFGGEVGAVVHGDYPSSLANAAAVQAALQCSPRCGRPRRGRASAQPGACPAHPRSRRRRAPARSRRGRISRRRSAWRTRAAESGARADQARAAINRPVDARAGPEKAAGSFWCPMLQVGRSRSGKTTDGVTMLASGFDDLRTRMLPRLAALSCALSCRAATVFRAAAGARRKPPEGHHREQEQSHRPPRRRATTLSFVNDADEPLGYTVDLHQVHAIDCAAVRAARPEDRIGTGDR